MPQDSQVIYIPANAPPVLAATAAAQLGRLEELAALLAENPWLAIARFGEPACHRTLLHAATDWPGNFPNGPAVVNLIVGAGADVNAHSRFDSHTETPLHWAASSGDVAVLDALLDAGANIEASGAVLGGGSALADACGFGTWEAAHRLVERGARTTLTDAAALGLMERLETAFADAAIPEPGQVTGALWSAARANQLGAAQYLLARGAHLDWVGWDDMTPLDAAESNAATEVAAWLRSIGARHALEVA